MHKLWLDVETGGLDYKINPMLQIAILVEVDGKITDKYMSYIKPPKKLIIEDDALKLNGITLKAIKKFPTEEQVIKELITILDKYPQMSIYGYNSRFDLDFFSQLFKRNNVSTWGYFDYYDVDTFALVKRVGIVGKRYDEKKKKNVPCKKLKCICDLFGIKFDAHDALEDIKATRKLDKLLVKRFLK